MDSNILPWVSGRQVQIAAQGGPDPVVTLAYAQSLDGCLTIRPGQPTAISGPESKRFTHHLRALHDGILIGSGTLLADDPKLDVRLAPGPHPRPVLLDAALRVPLTARLVHSAAGLIVFTSVSAPLEKVAALRSVGVVVQVCASQDGFLDLKEVLAQLAALGIKTLMVEGGVQVLRSFLREQRWHLAVVTIAPRWLGGYGGVGPALTSIPLNDVQVETAGTDILLAGKR